jgi:hypothetical protein
MEIQSTLTDFSYQDLMLLAEMVDDYVMTIIKVSALYDYYKSSMIVHQGNSPQKTLDQFFTHVTSDDRKPVYLKLCFETPLDDMPLYINHEIPFAQVIARWRMRIAK